MSMPETLRHMAARFGAGDPAMPTALLPCRCVLLLLGLAAFKLIQIPHALHAGHRLTALGHPDTT